MNPSDIPALGRLVDDTERRRDAVHVAIAPVTAAQPLRPGQHVGLIEEGNTELVGPTESPIGIVDPFLTDEIRSGQRIWLLLYPDSVTGMRHIWTHPAFSAAAAKARVMK